ncbi:Cytochrome P450 6k1 [Pseudolycoriella hygida]|uniref:Cytochrome P450 6k1 n=1 Tax=Pseudolycoriella hygida TaxID=35572 RepID=A0A9Q0RYR2_9DIPT|nr:Cytochrome P450 6k1 [Pseudolycoriella hygida]
MGLLFSETIYDATALLLLAFTASYMYIKHLYSYWKRMGVKYLEPTFPFGNFGPTIFQQKPGGELVAEIYKQNNDPFIGIYGALRPLLVVRDPNIIRSIFIKDFQHFVDRGVYIDEHYDPLSGHLFSMNGEKWKNLRVKLSPVFTSGKLKAMFSTLLNCGEPLQKYINKMASTNETIEVRELAARYTTDIIASVAFGIDVNAIDNPDTDFRRYGRKALEMSFKNGLRAFSTLIYPKLQKLLKLKSVDDDVESFMINVVKDTLTYRERNNVIRKDLMQLMIQLRNTGTVQNDGEWDTKITHDEKKKTLTLNEMAAQAWVFFIAGFETSSTTLSFCLYELAKNPNIQNKVHEEIDQVIEKHNGQLTYDAVHDMKYLEWCIDETLRKYPIVPILNRECTQRYKVPGTNYTMEKGTAVLIPVLGLQRDPKYYSQPDEFIPERFSPENLKSFDKMPYMPFGDGPRVCIGLRLGKLQTKVGLILMLQNFTYQLTESMQGELKMSAKTFLLAPECGVTVKMTPRLASS